jgi:two-component system NtrC family sensor kinase
VAGQWRIRHKLMVGLGLVVAVMAILLAGAVPGLLSYKSSMGLMESKLNELHAAQEFNLTVIELARVDDEKVDINKRVDNLRNRIKLATDAVIVYKRAYDDTVEKGRLLSNDPWTPSQVESMVQLLDTLSKNLAKRENTLKLSNTFSNDPPIRKSEDFRENIDLLEQGARDLEVQIYKQLLELKEKSRAESTRSLWIVGVTSILSIVLMAGLLRFYYNWVFNPLRDLLLGVNRLAKGEFDQRINVNSGDEMQDLAAAFNDMTGRLNELYRNLAQQVNERSRQLVRSERLASVGFLAAGVAHEINNPLASIAFCSEALEARMSELLSRGAAVREGSHAEVVLKYLKMIQQEAFRCKEITQKLLEFSRSAERRREATDLGELIQSVLDITRHLQNHKGKRIVFDPSVRVTAWVNSQEIKSVVLNLVVNSLDSMEDGGTLTIGMRARDGLAEMTFGDTGCGMTAEVLENIFEPFFTRSRTGKGTGLGLTISHRIVTGHGGEIEAASPGPNQGSTFTVRLPVQATPETAGKEETEAESPEKLFRRRSAA